MASKGDIEREKKLKKLHDRYAAKRKELKKRIKDPKVEPKERTKAMWALDKLPKNSSSVRRQNRCSITGNARGYNRLFGISRATFRELAGKGKIPGVKKASW